MILSLKILLKIILDKKTVQYNSDNIYLSDTKYYSQEAAKSSNQY